MTIWRLILREIVCRKTNFLLSALAVLVAVGSVVAAISLLDRYAVRGEQRAAEQQVELQKKLPQQNSWVKFGSGRSPSV